jgi:ATP-dependent helicase HrpA
LDAPARPAESQETLGIRLFATRAEAAAEHTAGVRWLLLRKFAKDLAFVRRYHKIPAEFDRAALYFGGRESVEKAIEEALARDVFEREIRTQAEYTAYEAEVGRTLFEKGHTLTQTTLKVFSLNASLRAELGKGSGGGAGKSGATGTSAAKTGEKTLSLYELSKLKERVVPEYLDAINADLDRLVPKNFLQIYTVARLVRIPRYIEGLKIRLERGRIGPEKDKAKAAQVEPYVFELLRLDAALKSGTQYPIPNFRPGPAAASLKQGQGIASPNSEKRLAVEELRWMIEEFKLALFAPEIKAAFPISAVRLARKIREIDAIV